MKTIERKPGRTWDNYDERYIPPDGGAAHVDQSKVAHSLQTMGFWDMDDCVLEWVHANIEAELRERDEKTARPDN